MLSSMSPKEHIILAAQIALVYAPTLVCDKLHALVTRWPHSLSYRQGIKLSVMCEGALLPSELLRQV